MKRHTEAERFALPGKEGEQAALAREAGWSWRDGLGEPLLDRFEFPPTGRVCAPVRVGLVVVELLGAVVITDVAETHRASGVAVANLGHRDRAVPRRGRAAQQGQKALAVKAAAQRKLARRRSLGKPAPPAWLRITGQLEHIKFVCSVQAGCCVGWLRRPASTILRHRLLRPLCQPRPRSAWNRNIQS